MMQLQNTPDPDCNVSPAQIVFGRPLRDAFAFANRLEKFTNEQVHPVWRHAWQQKEEKHSANVFTIPLRHVMSTPDSSALNIGDRCYIQNQTGNHPRRWDRSGTVVELHGHDSYTLKLMEPAG